MPQSHAPGGRVGRGSSDRPASIAFRETRLASALTTSPISRWTTGGLAARCLRFAATVDPCTAQDSLPGGDLPLPGWITHEAALRGFLSSAHVDFLLVR